MRPALAGDDLPYDGLTHAIFSCQDVLADAAGLVAGADLGYLRGGQLRAAVRLALRATRRRNAIKTFREVAPGAARDQVAESRRLDPEFSGECHLCFPCRIPAAAFQHDHLGQPRSAAALTAIGPAVAHPVCRVLLRCAITQVDEPVIKIAAGPVQGLHASRALADECQED